MPLIEEVITKGASSSIPKPTSVPPYSEGNATTLYFTAFT